MFLRLVRATVSKGVKREYVRVVEAYRDASGKTRRRTIINLGRRDLLARHLDLDKLARLLHGDARADRAVRRAGVAAIGAWDWGPVLAVRQLWNELGLDHVVAQGGGDAAMASRSASGHWCWLPIAWRAPVASSALAQWLETDFVCDRHGRRWIAAWRDEAERKASRTPRVRVAGRQLQQWYRLVLIAGRYGVLRSDLNLFRGQGTAGRANGHSRDGKPRNPQVLVGLVMVDGWPIAHHVFAGNRRDAMTVSDVVIDLEQRFGLKRIVFVGDRRHLPAINSSMICVAAVMATLLAAIAAQRRGVFDYIAKAYRPHRNAGSGHGREVTAALARGDLGAAGACGLPSYRSEERPGVRAHPTRQFEWNRVRHELESWSGVRRRRARRAPRESGARRLPSPQLRDHGRRCTARPMPTASFAARAVPVRWHAAGFKGRFSSIPDRSPIYKTDEHAVPCSTRSSRRSTRFSPIYEEHALDMRTR